MVMHPSPHSSNLFAVLPAWNLVGLIHSMHAFGTLHGVPVRKSCLQFFFGIITLASGFIDLTISYYSES